MTPIITRLLGPLGTYVFGGLSIVLLVMVIFGSLQNAGLRKSLDRAADDLAQARVDLAQCRANAKTLDGALKRQSAAIGDLERAGQDATRAANDALRAAQKAAKPYQASAARIAAAKPGADLCESTRQLFVDILKEERR